MILSAVLILLTVATPLLIEFLTGIYTIWWTWLIFLFCLPLIFALWFGMVIVYLFFTSLFMKPKEDEGMNPYAFSWVHQMVYFLTWASGTRVKMTGAEKVPEEKCLFVLNHLSNFDPVILMTLFYRRKMLFITKPENITKLPIAGPYIGKAGYIPIDRDNARNAVKAIRKASNYLKEGTCDMGICPEGTRSRDYQLHDFHAGSFKIATYANCPIVVCCIQNTEKIHKHFPFRLTHVSFDILKVIKPEDYADMDTQQLAQYSHDLIAEKLNQGKKD